MKNKILHVINSISPGGAEILLANSLSPGGLQDHSDNIVVYFRGTSYIEQRIDKNIPVYSLNYCGILSLPSVLLKLRKIIQDEKVDIVHSHLNPAGLYTHLICPADIPHIHTLHTTYSMDTKTRPLVLFLEKHFYFTKKNYNIILLSDFIKEDFLKSVSFKGRAFVLNNFVSDSFFRDTVKYYEKGRPLKLVAVGSLQSLKNFEYLLTVFTFLKDLDIILDIYGNGNISKFEYLIKREKIKVRMMGHENDLSDILHNYDLFIMPSKYEGFPLALFEAMASGLPVMLSNIPPLKSIIKENGIYFDLDNAKGTADIIRSIFDKKTDINEMAVKGRAYAENTARKNIYCKKILGIYENLQSLRESKLKKNLEQLTIQ